VSGAPQRHVIELAPRHKRGLGLRGPLMNASGVLGFAGEYRGLVGFSRLGAFVTNALTLNPRTPARPPNAVPLPNGVLIHTGLPNPGVGAAVRRYAREWARLGPPVIVHLAATTLEEVALSLERLEPVEAVSGIELGLRDDVEVGDLTALVRAALGGPPQRMAASVMLPLIVRLPVGRAADLCEAAAQAGAHALTIGAPPRGSAQVGDRSVTGRLYGPEHFPLALEALRAVAGRGLGLPLIGAGGVFSIEDAQAMLDAGAVAVQVDAALWNDPGLIRRWGERLA
jgi:dihydroorotate dehydrogenase (NAD+) catalytic subunit